MSQRNALARQYILTFCLLTLIIGGAFYRPTTAVAQNKASRPQWMSSAVIYAIYPNIFSTEGNFAGIDAQLTRLKNLGVNVIWIMPVTPTGQNYLGHPAIGSPYCVHDYYGVNPSYGSPDDLKKLVADCHRHKIRVLLDEVLNHTAWDNELLRVHPEFYVHSDNNPNNTASISMAFNYSDVAQLNYSNTDLWTYMNNMTAYWIKTYHVDGFRFDCADNPYGPTRKIPAAFWKQLGKHLQKVKPDVLLLGECESPELALNPFQLDYGWHLYDALKSAFNGGDASKVMTTWNSDYAGDFPSGMLHMSMQDNWDKSRDIAAFGGLDAAKAAAVFNFTTNGVPLVYNGMEIGNGAGDVNPHDPIAWTTGDQSFTVFYRKLITLRLANPALQQGTMTWLQSTTPSQVLSYARQRDGKEFVILINTSSKPASGALNSMISGNWLDVAPNHENSSKTDNNPGSYILQPHQFAIYERLSKNTNQLH